MFEETVVTLDKKTMSMCRGRHGWFRIYQIKMQRFDGQTHPPAAPFCVEFRSKRSDGAAPAALHCTREDLESLLAGLLDLLAGSGQAEATAFERMRSALLLLGLRTEKNSLEGLVDAAHNVVVNWESGDLAASVRDLAFQLREMGRDPEDPAFSKEDLDDESEDGS